MNYEILDIGDTLTITDEYIEWYGDLTFKPEIGQDAIITKIDAGSQTVEANSSGTIMPAIPWYIARRLKKAHFDKVLLLNTAKIAMIYQDAKETDHKIDQVTEYVNKLECIIYECVRLTDIMLSSVDGGEEIYKSIQKKFNP